LPDGTGYIQPFVDQAINGSTIIPGKNVEWLQDLRKMGAGVYTERGLPSRRDEYWRYTNLNLLDKNEYKLQNTGRLIDVPSLPHRAVTELASYRIVFVNGYLRPDLCVLDDMPDGVLISGLGDMIAAAPERLEPYLGKNINFVDMPMAALNTAFIHDGLFLFVDSSVELDKPVHLLSIVVPGSTPIMVQPRNLVVLGADSKVTLIESHIGNPGVGYFNNIVSEHTLGDGAQLNHYTFQEESTSAVHIAGTALKLGASSSYDGFLLQSGGLVARVETRALLNGIDADCRLDGIYLGTNNQLLDTTTYVEHVAPNCRSRQVYKGVLDKSSRGVFQGKIHVREGAQKTDGHQLSRALLLSNRAEIDAKPELEIYADDVKCSHGASVGELDSESLFYLMSRGITFDEARRILIEAFVSEALSEIRLDQVAEDFSAHIRNWLQANINFSELA
jgi:Fe-S cluster assembly protein SufD|tara:strand:- start:3042 stop:4382 length:1341 start_codon:yes stop_codon:yes gene_type:complete